MINFARLRRNHREFLALTGLTLPEFQLLLDRFTRVCDRLDHNGQTVEGRLRKRRAGGGCKPRLRDPPQKLLFLLIYLKTYPLQVLLGELFGLSQPTANQWIHRLLPLLRKTLKELGVRPERVPRRFARSRPSQDASDLIIDGTERRRQRPKSPAKQALHYSGRTRTHCDRNLLIVNVRGERVGFLSQTYAGRIHDKRIADTEAICYPPGTVLYQDTGFQGYHPKVKRTEKPKKKAAGTGTHRHREAEEPQIGSRTRQRGTCYCRSETLPHRQRCVA